MAYAISKAEPINDTNWVYHHGPRRVKYAFGVLIMIAAAVFVSLHDFQNLPAAVSSPVVAAVFMIAALVSMTSQGTTIELNRSEGSVRKTEQLLFFRKRRSYHLGDFQAIRLIEQVRTVEEGYLAISYAVVLQGRNRSCDLFSLDDAKEGMQLCREIISFFAGSGYALALQNAPSPVARERDRS